MSPGVALPLFKIHLGGTVPPFKMHSEGIVPSFKMHRRVCKNVLFLFFTWIWLVQQTSTRVNLYSLKQTNIHSSLTLVKESHVSRHNRIFIDFLWKIHEQKIKNLWKSHHPFCWIHRACGMQNDQLNLNLWLFRWSSCFVIKIFVVVLFFVAVVKLLWQGKQRVAPQLILLEDNLCRKMTFDWRWLLRDDDLRLKATFDGRQPLMKDDLWWKMSFGGTHSLTLTLTLLYCHLRTKVSLCFQPKQTVFMSPSCLV